MSYYYGRRSSNISLVVNIIIIIIIIVACCYRPINKASNIREEIATVTDKNIKNNNSGGKYLIYCKDTNGETKVYEITDSLIMGRFNSSDMYAEIEVGKMYKFEVGGSRNGFLSWYPNIYEYEEVRQ